MRALVQRVREASVTVTENQPSGTVVTVAVPYRSVTPGGASA